MRERLFALAQEFDRKLKQQYDRKQTIERAMEHGKIGPVPARRKGRIGGGSPGEKIHQYDLDSATFAGLVDKLGEKINSSANTARQAVTQVTLHKSKEHNELKPYVDELSKAIRKKDSAAKVAAIKNLKQQMKDWAERAPAIQSLARNIKWLPFFQRMKSDLEMIADQKLVLINGSQNLNENQISFIQNLLRNGRKITDAYRKHYQASDAKLQISFDNTVEYLDMVLDQLSIRTGVTV